MTLIEAIDLAIDTVEAVLRGEGHDPAELSERLIALKAAKASERQKQAQDELCRTAIRSLAARLRQRSTST